MVSVIIPTLNAGKQIGLLLEKLRSQTMPCEILVLDSSSDDATVSIARSYNAGTIVINRDDFDHGGSRTMAGKTAQGDIVAYLTQDALPADTEMLQRLIRPFADAATGAVYGRQLPAPDATPFAAHLRLFNYPASSCMKNLSDKQTYGIKTPFLSNSCAAYRRSALEAIGWFRDGMILGEDTSAGADLLRAGYTLAYAADATVHHSHNYTAAEEFRRYFDIGVFHAREAWLLEEFGGAGGEGAAYVMSAASHLLAGRRYLLLPELMLRSGLKLIGYDLGRIYKRLPLSLIRKMSMHPSWWEKNAGKGKGKLKT
ncbi:MAG: glycosyltransferase [Nitrospirae bacterium]|nr:MAG: glycosyltransferase [Nitrospirota bacterium]